MIEFDHVTRSYSGKVAVDDLSLSVPPGEIFALLGANGAGKTTAIRLLTGLLRPDSGTIRVCGHDLDGDLRQALRCLGYVPDEPFLYDKLSGREFLEFTAQMRGLNRRRVEECIAQETHNFELADYLDDLIETYSHGMKQRLIFAAALLHRPPVVIIDEPMVGLDPRSMRMVKDLLREQSGSGMIVFMSTHILAVAEEIADRIGVLDRGRLQFVGSIAQLRKELASPQTSLESLFLQLTGGANGTPAAATASRPEPAE
ncbi:MAG: ABC transporter ATP-binding protein [Thermoguttaceae bacterium]|jgi:ABC-2 type transport system ATP-binding protein